MRIFVLLLISVLPNMLFGQIDTLDSFFNVLPTEFYDNVYLLDNYTNANDYEQVEIVYDGGVYIFELNQQYVGVSLLNIDSQLSFGFYENSLDTFRLSNNRCIVFSNPFPFIYHGAPSLVEMSSLDFIESMDQDNDGTLQTITGRVPDFVFDGYIYNRSSYRNVDCVPVDSNKCLCTEVNFNTQKTHSYLYDFAQKTLKKFTIDLVSGDMKHEKFSW